MSFEERLQELATEILNEFTTRGLTLSIAESCTGGLATSLLTDLDGSSEILSFSIVTYSTDAKEEFLGLPSYIISDFGSISIECAKLMAEGLLSYEVDVGLSTTGVIGESFEDKLKGTAFIAIAISGHETYAKELTLDPKQTRIQLKQEIVKILFEATLQAINLTF